LGVIFHYDIAPYFTIGLAFRFLRKSLLLAED